MMMGADVDVRVNAPEYVLDTFEVTIDVTDVTDLNSGTLDFTFDPDFTNVVDIEEGGHRCYRNTNDRAAAFQR